MAKRIQTTPTYDGLIAEIMAKTTGPLSAAGIAFQLQTALPSTARNPQTIMRQHIRKAMGRHLIFLDADTVLPLRLAYQGARFRIPLQNGSFSRGMLPLGKEVKTYLPQGFNWDRLQLVDQSGNPIPAHIIPTTEKLPSPFGLFTQTDWSANLGTWYRTQKMYAKDHILVTILDWEQGVLQLERESFGQRNQALLAERNRFLADLFFELLENATREKIDGDSAVPTVYARLPDKGGYPPGSWGDVLETDGRMYSNGYTIFYSDSDRQLHSLPRGGLKERKSVPTPVLSKTQREQVYQFKAYLLHRPTFWREIQIQGKQTLADLDAALRSAFNHDHFDHLGGFWKIIPRNAQSRSTTNQKSKRTVRNRQVKIGTIEPMEGGDGAQIKIAELDLVVGGQILYVYDFGDWIEHTLTLQAIETPKMDEKYPREVARNEPAYAYCVECLKKGEKRVARWICPQCTTGPYQQILLCEKCIHEHADHNSEKLFY